MILIDKLQSYNVVLASKSPRRQELLSGMGISFSVITKDVEENYPMEMPVDDVPAFLSKQKSMAFSDTDLPEKYLLITADTLVMAETEILGKPKDRDDALRMMHVLSGKAHHVVTGVTVRTAAKSKTFAVKSKVRFAKLDEDEMAFYIDHYKPYDKAGAYGIQEWIGYVGISGLSGSFYNVMGFPTCKLYEVLKSF
jgi:MAF protein